MNIIENKSFDEERALYGTHELLIKNCSFDGPADGESAVKESGNIKAEHCFFNLRYPFWHDQKLTIANSEMTSGCRAALWYSNHVNISNTKLHGIKALRECSDVAIQNCDIISPEFGWSVQKIINCEMIETDLAFEKSQVEAEIITKIDSVKNPLSGRITAPDIGEVILDDCNAKGKIIIS